MIRFTTTLSLLLFAIAANAQVYQFSSGDQQNALVELYTSEGCSSCPPADRWISKLDDSGELWNTFVPVAFHVDYWDYIGWKDRFAAPEFGDRQRQYAKEGNVRTVYTPGLFLNGQEWRGWYRGQSAESSAAAKPGTLRIDVDDSLVTAQFESADLQRSELVLHVVLLGMDIETRVGAGENNGKLLKHDFVVLNYQTGPMSGDIDSGLEARLRLAGPSVAAERFAIAAWVSSPVSQVPIQATGGFIGSSGQGVSGRR